MKLRDKYQGLSRQETLDKAYELGVNYEANSTACSQCTVAALHELIGFEDVIVKVATSQSGGTARQCLGTCGALIGGTIVLDYFFGRSIDHMSYLKRAQENIDRYVTAIETTKVLADKFWNRYGTIHCANIQRQLFGRFFYVMDPDEANKLEEAGAHSDPTKCLQVVGSAVRWVMEILVDKGAIKL